MIDDKLLAEIKETHKNARFGYGSITGPIYVKHVGALLQYYDASLRVPLEPIPFSDEDIARLEAKFLEKYRGPADKEPISIPSQPS